MSAFTTLADYLEHSAERAPDRPALVDPSGRTLTYRELDEAANRVAHWLAACGVGKGDRVGLCLPKSAESVAGIYGALKLGAVYVPVDYTAPAERNRFIFSDCQVKAAIIDARCAAVFDAPGEGGHQPDAVLVCGEPVPETLAKPRWHGAGELKEQPASRPKADRPHSDDLAYILYTSGSTGLPKGVMLSQENATSYVDWCSEVFAPTPDDRFTSHAPFHFDLSILDLYVPAKHGAALYLISEELGKTAASLGPFIDEHRITCWYSVPSILALMTQYGKLEETDASSLRIVNFAGEVFPIKYLRRLRDLWPHADFYNLYGPTETNVCTYYKIPATIPPDRQEPYPIGKICSHCEALIIGDDGKPVADGGEGLLCIAGTPVLQGYWGDEQRTDGAFMTHGGRRYYNTGDVVRPDENGDFVFLGRKDRMVKRHGYRIELGEIEAAMYKHPGVAEAAAIALLDGAGVVTLRAVLSAKDGAKLGAIAMKQHSAAHLPSYMIPDTFTFLDALPQTSTGKIDYQALIRQAGGG